MGFAPTGASAESALHSLSPYNSDQASLAVFVANYSVLTLSLILSLILLERGGWFAACQTAWGWNREGPSPALALGTGGLPTT